MTISKRNHLLSLDEEIVQKLQGETNASALVNNLLLDHYAENRDFKKLRLMNRIKNIKSQEAELKIEKKRLEADVKNYKDYKPKQKRITENTGRTYGKTVTHQGSFGKDDLRSKGEGQ